MNGTERYVSIIQNSIRINAESGFISHLKGYTAGFTHNRIATLRIEFAVYTTQFLCFRTQLLQSLIPSGFHDWRLHIEIALSLGLLINRKHT